MQEGRTLSGKITMPPGRGMLEYLNNAAHYLEFESFDGDRRYLAKGSVAEVKQVSVPRAGNLNQRLRDLDGRCLPATQHPALTDFVKE